MSLYKDSPHKRLSDGASTGAWWAPLRQDDAPSDQAARIECQLCPRKCHLKDGDRGFCFVRENRDGRMVLTTYGKSTGFCIDPIEKKPLNHFYPGTAVLSFGTAGCNLGCQFCQNWDISKSREVSRLSSSAEPETIAQAALGTGCKSVAYTYNDPVIWAEYAIDTAKACREVGIQNVAVTAGYICASARAEFFEFMDAANVDLKAFTDDFYEKITYSRLQPVLDTLAYLKQETNVWFELTNLIIPQANDNPDDLRKMCSWIVKAIGDDVPIHFTAFHPDFRMTDRPRTDPDTLILAQEIARSEGLSYAYIGNVHDAERQSTRCHKCSQLLIARDWYELGTYAVDAQGCCASCGTKIPGRFDVEKGSWGSKRQPIRIGDYAAAPSPPASPLQSTRLFTGQSIQSTHLTSATPNATARENALNSSSAHPSKETTVSEESNTQTADANKSQDASMHPGARLARNILDLDKLGSSQTKAICKAAAAWFRASVLQEQQPNADDLLGDLSGGIVMGAFVTAKRGNLLRGCCGVLGKPMPLGGALLAAASKTAREDQRMAPISPTELPYLTFDVTLLGPFKRIQAEGAERKDAIEIGKQGLMIQRGERSGLLLPSVAVERGWTAEQFLHGVCQKAGLPIGAWESSDAAVFTFNGKSHGGNLTEFVEIESQKPKPAAITPEVLKEYVKIAGDNIVALITGGTPSYVIPHLPDATVNALVISMQWGSRNEGDDADAQGLRQGNLIQVSFRPGVPFQNTLYQMCQQAARMFHAQKFSGQLQIGLTIGFDPALHGFGSEADLEGIDTDARGLVISDARHCAMAYHPEHSAEELREKLRSILPIGSREATVHSLQIVSTMPHVISMSAPIPSRATGTRPPAVAGKFYPAEDAARRAMVGTFFKDDEPTKASPLAIMVPHAGIKYSGRIASKVWRSVDDLDSRTLIVISPKHTPNGVNWSVCPFERWRLSSTTSFDGDAELASKIAEGVTPIELDAAAHQGEHGIEVQLPILERVAPKSKVVGMALHSGSWEDIQSAAKEFAAVIKDLPEMPLLVISSDMNHYAPDDENRRRDRLALDALATGDPQELINTCRQNEISMCGQVAAAFIMETLRQLELNFKVEELDYTTSAEVSGDKSQVVGYAGCMLVPA